ncbi:NAD(P)H-binding protein [Tuwongella immobilis]|uniref:NAD(P)H-binding protein n=1 Tax=Tuwongella immobilis TaxID=692036 RepID=UPI0036F360FA
MQPGAILPQVVSFYGVASTPPIHSTHVPQLRLMPSNASRCCLLLRPARRHFAARFPRFARGCLHHRVIENIRQNRSFRHRTGQVIESSPLEWTIVRPSMFVSHRPGRPYRIQDRLNPNGGWKISREDVADFVLSEYLRPQWVRRHPAVAY